ncbi:MAG: MFS transporter [Pseudomonadota bacterium]
MTATPPIAERQPTWFLIVFAMAAAGGSVAYVPLLTVLLPVKVTALTGTEDVTALARLTFFGAMMASIANIAFGMLSDRTGNRLPWILAGLTISTGFLVAIGYARDLTQLSVMIILWQIGLNMMLGPLFAWAGDCFPDEQKGVLGGALALAPAMGAIAGSLVTFDALVPSFYRLHAVGVLVFVLVMPAIVLGRSRRRTGLMVSPNAKHLKTGDKRRDWNFTRMWIARFLVQISEAGLFAFLLFWLRSLSSEFHENAAANIFSLVLIVSVPIALWAGRWSDARNRPIVPLIVCAVLSALGLLGMALAGSLEMGIAGYVAFGISASVFLSLNTAQTLRVLPRPEQRGRDMGLFNLSNTVPSLVMPWLTLTLVPGFGFAGLFALFAAFALIASLVLTTISLRE